MRGLDTPADLDIRRPVERQAFPEHLERLLPLAPVGTPEHTAFLDARDTVVQYKVEGKLIEGRPYPSLPLQYWMLTTWLPYFGQSYPGPYQVATETSQIGHTGWVTMTLLSGLPNSGRHLISTYKTALRTPNVAVLSGGHFFLLPSSAVRREEAIEEAVESTLRGWWRWVMTPLQAAEVRRLVPTLIEAQDSPIRHPPPVQAARKVGGKRQGVWSSTWGGGTIQGNKKHLRPNQRGEKRPSAGDPA